MKTNENLENARSLLVHAIKECRDYGGEVSLGIIYNDLLTALTELDTFRNDKLQDCKTCGEEQKEVKHECESTV